MTESGNWRADRGDADGLGMAVERLRAAMKDTRQPAHRLALRDRSAKGQLRQDLGFVKLGGDEVGRRGAC